MLDRKLYRSEIYESLSEIIICNNFDKTKIEH